MANRALFDTRAARSPAGNTRNNAGGTAYLRDPYNAIAQYAVTGTFGDTFYVDAQQQLDELVPLLPEVSPEYIAKVALYARSKAHMKDMPAFLAAYLVHTDVTLFERIAPHVLDNGRMVRNFVQILRAGTIGGKRTLPHPARRFVTAYLRGRAPYKLLNESVGNSPSVADMIRMVHPKPTTKEQAAFFAYLIGRSYEESDLPLVVRNFEAWKREPTGTPPNVEFRLLAGVELSTAQWSEIADNAPWHMLRMNLNTFMRHGVWKDEQLVRRAALKLADPALIAAARVWPTQLLAAYKHVDPSLPMALQNALQDAMEIAVDNVPRFDFRVAVAPDVSGSMSSALTGARRGATSKVRCIDTAALISAVVLRRNPDALVMPFDTNVYMGRLNPRDSIMTLARSLASFGGGGTACSLPALGLRQIKERVGLLWIVSDNESWADRHALSYAGYAHRSTNPPGLSQAWESYKDFAPDAKLVCQDLTPGVTTQALNRQALNIGGHSDAVFDVVKSYVEKPEADAWRKALDSVTLPS